jgi:hypothetical protein
MATKLRVETAQRIQDVRAAENEPSDDDDLSVRIAEAAYYRAEKRGFEPGYELQDWVEAEQEVMALLQGDETAD